MRLAPWDPDNEMIEDEWHKAPVRGTNWGLIIAVGGSLLFWAALVYVASKAIAG
jgi:hypothetical protein